MLFAHVQLEFPTQVFITGKSCAKILPIQSLNTSGKTAGSACGEELRALMDD